MKLSKSSLILEIDLTIVDVEINGSIILTTFNRKECEKFKSVLFTKHCWSEQALSWYDPNNLKQTPSITADNRSQFCLPFELCERAKADGQPLTVTMEWLRAQFVPLLSSHESETKQSSKMTRRKRPQPEEDQ